MLPFADIKLASLLREILSFHSTHTKLTIKKRKEAKSYEWKGEKLWNLEMNLDAGYWTVWNMRADTTVLQKKKWQKLDSNVNKS